MKFTEDTTENRIKWMARFFKVGIEKYITWRVRTAEESHGAYDILDKEAQTLEEAVRLQWVARKMDKKIAGVLVYRDINYRDETDAQLGISEGHGK